MKQMNKIMGIAGIVFLLWLRPAWGYYEGIQICPRAMGMGESFVGVADDVNAIFYNPAGLALLDRLQLSGGYLKSYAGLDLGGVSQIFFATAGRIPSLEKWGTFGVAWPRRGTNIVFNELEGGSPTTSTYPLLSENIVYLSWGRNIRLDFDLPDFFRLPAFGSKLYSENIYLGVNVKLYYNGWNRGLPGVGDGGNEWWDGTYSATGFGVDFGGLYNPRVLPELWLGMNFSDLLKTDIGIHTPDYVESRLKLGAGYLVRNRTFTEKNIQGIRIPAFTLRNLRLASDLVISTKRMAYHHLHLGGEKQFTWGDQDFFLRSGCQLGVRGYRSLALGAGYRYFVPKAYGGLPFLYGFQFDYAFILPVSGIQSTAGKHSFALTLLQGARVDRIPPVATLAVTPDVISPDGDGTADELRLALTAQDQGGIKDWEVRIIEMVSDTGRDTIYHEVVKSYRGLKEPPEQLVWDGRPDKQGEPVANGDYYCELILVDRGDNRASSGLQKIAVNVPKINFEVTALAETFSPNGDSIEDQMGFKLTVDPRIKVAAWALIIERMHQETLMKKVTTSTGDSLVTQDTAFYKQVRKFSGRERPSPMLAWDGLDDNDRLVPHGHYRYWLELIDLKGNRKKTPYKAIRVDLEGPQTDLDIIPVVFSPDGDGKNDFTVFSLRFQEESGVQHWRLEVFRQDKGDSLTGDPVQVFTGDEKDKRVLQWNGQDKNDELCENGTYLCRVIAWDKLQNKSISGLRNLMIGQEDKLYRVFSPNGDGKFDQVNIKMPPTSRAYDLVRLTIRDQNRQVCKQAEKPGKSFTVDWDGKSEQDYKLLPEGVYAYSFTFIKEAQPVEETPAKIIRIDTTPPEITLLAVPWTFCPVNAELTTFSMLATDVSAIGTWRLEIADKEGNTIKAFNGEGNPPQSMEWDGRDEEGQVDERGGKYYARLIVEDVVANRDTSAAKELVILGEKKIIPLDPIHFETGKAVIKQESYPVLQEAAKILKAAGELPIAVHGHTDNVGGAKVNLRLSRERAQAVVDYITRFLGIPVERFVEVKGFGDTMPLADNATEQGRAINRRTEIMLVEDLSKLPGREPAPSEEPETAPETE